MIEGVGTPSWNEPVLSCCTDTVVKVVIYVQIRVWWTRTILEWYSMCILMSGTIFLWRWYPCMCLLSVKLSRNGLQLCMIRRGPFLSNANVSSPITFNINYNPRREVLNHSVFFVARISTNRVDWEKYLAILRLQSFSSLLTQPYPRLWPRHSYMTFTSWGTIGWAASKEQSLSF